MNPSADSDEKSINLKLVWVFEDGEHNKDTTKIQEHRLNIYFIKKVKEEKSADNPDHTS